MSRLFLALLVMSTVGSPILWAAEVKPPTPSAAAAEKSSLAGQFTGKWKSTSDTAGDLRLMLKQNAAATWSAEASFTFEGTEVPMKMKTLHVEGTKVLIVFDWQADGAASQSKLSGELTGDTLKGTYETSGAAGASNGTWIVTRS